MPITHKYSYSVLLCCALMIVAIIAVTGLIETKPTRSAVIDFIDPETQVVKTARIPIRKAASLTDAKVINWVNKVVATCFSLTLSNMETKSNYCGERYFSTYARVAYQIDYVNAIKETMSNNTANFYTGTPYEPVIIQPFSLRAGRAYYTVFVQTLSSLVERKRTSPSSKGVWFFVAPSLKAKDESQFTIIGMRI